MILPSWLPALLISTWASLITVPAMAGDIRHLLNRLVKQEKLPGAVLLVSGPKGQQMATAGLANRKTQEAMTAQTRFYIASSGKLVTAAATLQLVQANKLKLAEQAYPWVKDIPGISRLRNIQSVTVAQLLKHRSGLAEYYDDEFELKAAEQPNKRWSVDESLAFAYDKKAGSKPGHSYNYTNTNFVLLGKLIENVDQAPYAKAVQRRIFDTVGMPATSVGAHPAPTGLAHGYTRNDNGKLIDVSFSGWNAITGDGAIVTTAADYDAFLRALFRDAKLLPANMVARMCEPQTEEPDSGYGLGCSVEDTAWGPAWGHSGTISGFNAETWYLPKLDVTVVFLTNGDFDSDDPNVLEQAVRVYLKK